MAIIVKYVNSGTIGHDTNSGNDPTLQPWKTVQHGVDWFRDNRQPGDSFELKLLGEFHENVVMDGEKYSDITIETWQVGATTPGKIAQFCEARVPCGGDVSSGTPIQGTVFTIHKAHHVTLKNLTILLAHGGVIANDADGLELDSCCIHHHTKDAEGAGFAIVASKDVTVSRCYIWANTSHKDGGGGFCFACHGVHITDSEFYLNESRSNGGGLGISRCRDVTIAGSVFGAALNPVTLGTVGPNHAEYGGGISIFETPGVVFRSHARSIPIPSPGHTVVNSNLANEAGGGIFAEFREKVDKVALAGGTEISSNRAAEGGGIAIIAIRSKGPYPELHLDHVFVRDNHATQADGGGIHALDTQCVIRDTTISGNSADRTGGGIYIFNNPELPQSISGGVIEDNTSGVGGGGSYLFSCDLQATDVEIKNNSSGLDGGGMLCMFTDATLKNLRFIGNQAQSHGGGLRFWWQASLETDACLFQENTASYGGGLDFWGGTVTTANTTLTGNKATRKGGAMYLRGVTGTIDSTQFARNEAAVSGGGLYVKESKFSPLKGDFDVQQNTWMNNVASVGGDILVDKCELFGVGAFGQADAARVFSSNTFIPGPGQIKVK